MIFKGKVWKFGDRISTDLIMPGEGAHGLLDAATTAKMCMRANRPGWSSQVQKGDIIVAGINWGCGSSRPAPRNIKNLGISVVVAESMSRLFLRNAVNIGMPVLRAPGVSKIFNEGDMAEVNVETGEVTNLTTGKKIKGEPLPANSPPMQILTAGGLDPFWQQIKTAGGLDKFWNKK